MNRKNMNTGSKITQNKKTKRTKKSRGNNMSIDYTKEAKKYIVKKLRTNKGLKDDVELQAGEIEEHQIGDMIEEGKEGIKFIAERLQKKKGVNSNNHFFIAAAIYLVNEKEKIAKEQRYRERKQLADTSRTIGALINDEKTKEQLKKIGIHPTSAIPLEEREIQDVKKRLEQEREIMKENSRKKSQELYQSKIKKQTKKTKTEEKAEKKETKQQRDQRTIDIITFNKGEATYRDLPVAWPASPGIGQWMKREVLDPSYKKPVKVKMEYVKKMGNRTIVMRPIKSSMRPKREHIKAAFISFANVKTFFAVDDERKISIPPTSRDDHDGDEYPLEKIKKLENPEGLWELKVLKKGKDYISAMPIKKLSDDAKDISKKIIEERFMSLYNVNKTEFEGTYEIYDQGKNKLVYVNSEALNEDVMPRINGASWIRNYQNGERWIFELEAILFKKDKRVPILKPVKKIEDN
jgi:hypothetical protein